MKKRLRKKLKTQEKILFSLILACILTATTAITAIGAIEKKEISKLNDEYDKYILRDDKYFHNSNAVSEIQKKLDYIFDNIKDISIDYTKYSPSPYQIQGNFETGWNVNNFWNGNDNGGVAIGPFQIHSRYMLEPFFDYLKENAPYYFDLLNAQGGVKAVKQNDPKMKTFFCELCKNDSYFVELQAKFLDRDNFQPRMTYLKNQYGLDISQRGPAIEGLFRTMSANIGWRTNYVVDEMIKNLSIYFNISRKNVIQSNLLNKISDSDFVNVLQTSLNSVINKKIQYRFRNHLLSAYNSTIQNDVIPNLGKEVLTESKKNLLEQRNRQLKAEMIIETIKSEFNIIEKDQVNLVNMISNDTSDNFLNSKNTLASYINETLKNKNKSLLLKRKFTKSKKIKLAENDITFAKQDLFIKDDEDEINLPENDTPVLPPNNNEDIITVDKVIAKAKENKPKPSLLRKAELLLMDDILKDAVNILKGKKEETVENNIIEEIQPVSFAKKTNNTTLTKKALQAQKRAEELTVENVIAKSKKRKDGGKIKPQNDMSALLAEAASHLI